MLILHPVKVSCHDLCMGVRTGYEPPHGSIDAVSATANIIYWDVDDRYAADVENTPNVTRLSE